MNNNWKNRLWSLVLVCSFAVVLSFCNQLPNSSVEGSNSLLSGVAYADFKTGDINTVMFCMGVEDYEGTTYWYKCDSSDSITLADIVLPYRTLKQALVHDDLIAAGFRPCVGVAPGTYFFCK